MRTMSCFPLRAENETLRRGSYRRGFANKARKRGKSAHRLVQCIMVEGSQRDLSGGCHRRAQTQSRSRTFELAGGKLLFQADRIGEIHRAGLAVDERQIAHISLAETRM